MSKTFDRGWQTTKFKHLATIVSGQSPSSSDVNLEGHGLPFLQGCSEFGIKSPKPKAWCISPSKISKKGDWLFSVRAPVGKMNLSNCRYGIGRGLAAISPKTSSTDPVFLGYLLECSTEELKSLSTGSTFEAVAAGDIGGIVVYEPSFYEQRQIAAYLNRETAKIDKLIVKQQRLINLSKEKLTSMVVTDLRQHDNVRLRHCVDIMNRPVILEEGNCYSKLGMFNRGRGLFIKPSTEATEMGDSDFFWVREGDLIISGQFAWEGAVGIASKEHEHCVVSHRYPVLRGKPSILLTEYLLVLFWTDFGDFLLNENSRGAAGRNRPLNLRSLLNEKIPLPPPEIQKKVCELYVWRTRFLKTVEVQKQALLEHRQALITAAVTGKIDVRGLVTDEEVAALDAEPEVETTEEDFASGVVEDTCITEEE